MQVVVEWRQANPSLLSFLTVGLAVWLRRQTVAGGGLGMVAAAIVVGSAVATGASMRRRPRAPTRGSTAWRAATRPRSAAGRPPRSAPAASRTRTGTARRCATSPRRASRGATSSRSAVGARP